jgi:hypothetical protein
MITEAELLKELTVIAGEIFKANPMDKSRKQDVILARNAICYVARIRYKMKFKEIGKHFKKNHATIIHAVNKHDIDYKYVRGYRLDFDKFKAKSMGINQKDEKREVINMIADLTDAQTISVSEFIKSLVNKN